MTMKALARVYFKSLSQLAEELDKMFLNSAVVNSCFWGCFSLTKGEVRLEEVSLITEMRNETG